MQATSMTTDINFDQDGKQHGFLFRYRRIGHAGEGHNTIVERRIEIEPNGIRKQHA